MPAHGIDGRVKRPLILTEKSGRNKPADEFLNTGVRTAGRKAGFDDCATV